jgi:hypothetical protein
VRLYAEDPLPIPGFGSPLATVASGADGWVRVRKADLDAALLERYGKPVWAYAEAPGLGPNGEYGITAEDGDGSSARRRRGAWRSRTGSVGRSSARA